MGSAIFISLNNILLKSIEMLACWHASFDIADKNNCFFQ